MISTNEKGEEKDFIEPLLREEEKRYVTFPIRHPDIFDLYKKQVANFWVAEEIDMSTDLDDWNKLTEGERHFLKMVLAFFAASDSIVSENLIDRFSFDVKILEARYFYAFQNMMENCHSEVYSQLLETYIEDSDEKEKLFNAIRTIPCIKKKFEWAQKWIGDSSWDRLPKEIQTSMTELAKSDRQDPETVKIREWVQQFRPSFAERLFAYILVEGLLFSSSFCAIYWMKKRGVLPGLTLSNAYISRDEGLHRDHGVLLFNKLERKLSPQRALEILQGAVEVESAFVNEALPVRLLAMDAEKMIQHVQSVADQILVDCGYPKHYNVKTPFGFMTMLNVTSKSNFFERSVTAYSRAGVASRKNNY